MPERKSWLLLLYELPAGRGTSRVSVWRKLRKSGAVQLKSSTYILPDEPAHRERFQWLAAEVRESGGEATVVHASDIEGVPDQRIIALFNEARAQEYAPLKADLNRFIAANKRKAREDFGTELERLSARLEELRALDFFESPAGQDAAMQLDRARALHVKGGRKPPQLSRKHYHGRTWLTRPGPHIDRVGSAWLIRRFIDHDASFVFADRPGKFPEALPYDMVGVEFTHQGDNCTFETLLARFELEEPPLRRIAEAVHAADLDDGKYARAEALGLDRVFKGWVRLGWSDDKILERGAECFDGLYEYFRKRS